MPEITGYRKLTQIEIDLINKIKDQGNAVQQLLNELTSQSEDMIDRRWLAIAETDLQKGFMSAVRAIAQPTSF